MCVQYQSSCAPKLARVNIGCPVVRTDGRAVYGHVITKFSGMGRFTYPWCSAGALRAPELRYKTVVRYSKVRYLKFSAESQFSRKTKFWFLAPLLWTCKDSNFFKIP